jgi:4'-phosphopantetheinyl transferase
MCSPAAGVWLATARIDTDRPSRRCQSRLARALLKDLLGTVVPHAADAAIVSTDAGAPRLEGRSRLHVSISHDHAWLAVAVGIDRAVGVDVQVPVAGTGRRLARRCLGRHASLLASLPDERRDEELAWVWTVQESCVKLAGSGLAARPWTLDVPPFRTIGRIGDVTWHSLRGWSIVPLSCAYALPAAPLTPSR